MLHCIVILHAVESNIHNTVTHIFTLFHMWNPYWGYSIYFGFFCPDDGTDSLARNVGKKLLLFLISNCRRVLNHVCIPLGISPASDCCMSTFRKYEAYFILHVQPVKMEVWSILHTSIFVGWMWRWKYEVYFILHIQPMKVEVWSMKHTSYFTSSLWRWKYEVWSILHTTHPAYEDGSMKYEAYFILHTWRPAYEDGSMKYTSYYTSSLWRW